MVILIAVATEKGILGVGVTFIVSPVIAVDVEVEVAEAEVIVDVVVVVVVETAILAGPVVFVIRIVNVRNTRLSLESINTCNMRNKQEKNIKTIVQQPLFSLQQYILSLPPSL